MQTPGSAKICLYDELALEALAHSHSAYLIKKRTWTRSGRVAVGLLNAAQDTWDNILKTKEGARAVLKDRHRLAKEKKKREARKVSKKENKGRDCGRCRKSYSSDDASSSSSKTSADSSDSRVRPSPSKLSTLAAEYN